MMYKMIHVCFYVWFMIFRCASYMRQISPLWQACNHSWRCCILSNYHAHGAGGNKWLTGWWIIYKVVQQLCVCSLNMFNNMQYIQWGQFRNFLFRVVIIHLLKNSDFICKLLVQMRQVFNLDFVFLTCCSATMGIRWLWFSLVHLCATCCVMQLRHKRKGIILTV